MKKRDWVEITYLITIILVIGIVTMSFNKVIKNRDLIMVDLEIEILELELERIDLLEDVQSLTINLKDAQSKLRYLENELYGDNEDCTEEEEEEIDEEIIVETVAKIVSVEPTRVSLGTFEATAYTDNVQSQGKWVGQTATGRKPAVGVIAVDPKVIPLNTRLYVEGYGECVAGDTGGAIKGKIVDVFLNTQNECKTWGRKQVEIWRID